MFENETRFTLEIKYRFSIVHSFYIMLIMFAVIFIVGAGAGALYLLTDKTIAVTIWITVTACCIVLPFVFRSAMKKTLKKQAKSPLQDENNSVCFTFNENAVDIITKRFEVQNSSATINYPEIVKIVENKNLLFIYISTNMANVLDGNCMIKGDFAALREFLKAKFGTKYKIRKLPFNM